MRGDGAPTSPSVGAAKGGTTLEFELLKDKWPALTPAERVQLCRRLAQEAQSLGAAAPPRVKQTYLDLGSQWTQLAVEIERSLRR
jgi:hypothetical protein